MEGELFMSMYMPESPLDKIKGLVPVSEESVKRLEEHLSRTYLPNVRRKMREQAKDREAMRGVVLF